MKRKGKLVGASEEDVLEGVNFVNDSYERDIRPEDLRLVKVVQMRPEDFIDDRAHLGRDDSGWLHEYPEETWLEELRSSYSRDFDHMLAYHRAGKMPSAVQIDGEMADGRGRAVFHYAMGEKTMPVAVYTTKRGK